MKTVIVLGSGNSGAGGVRDYLMSRDDFQSPFIDQEFRIINDPDGINDLYVNLYKNFSINNAANAVNNFILFIGNCYHSRLNKKKKIYNKKIISLTKSYLNQIIKVKYNGAPRFFLDKLNNFKKLNFYFSRFILKKNAEKMAYGGMSDVVGAAGDLATTATKIAKVPGGTDYLGGIGQ